MLSNGKGVDLKEVMSETDVIVLTQVSGWEHTACSLHGTTHMHQDRPAPGRHAMP